jgi:hypothetical protein
MKRLLQFQISAVFGFALATPLSVHALAAGPVVWIFEAADDGAYAAGTRAMNEQRWPDAIREFDAVIAEKASKRVDAALYWKAYCLGKIGRRSDAGATCTLLRAKFPASSWNNDCGALSVDVQVAIPSMPPMPMPAPTPPFPPMISMYRGDRAPSPGSDEDLKLLALNSLAHQDPGRAMPILREMLAGNQSSAMKRHALFVLTQSRTAEAASILRDVVMGKMGPELQKQAIPMMGALEGKRANDELEEVYRTTQDEQVKRAVVSAFFISGDAVRMVELARKEMKRRIVSQLALMNNKVATDYMLELLK